MPRVRARPGVRDCLRDGLDGLRICLTLSSGVSAAGLPASFCVDARTRGAAPLSILAPLPGQSAFVSLQGTLPAGRVRVEARLRLNGKDCCTARSFVQLPDRAWLAEALSVRAERGRAYVDSHSWSFTPRTTRFRNRRTDVARGVDAEGVDAEGVDADAGARPTRMDGASGPRFDAAARGLEVGWLAGFEGDNWWFDASNPFAFRVFSTEALYGGGGYAEHDAETAPAWAAPYAASVAAFCRALRGRACRTFLELGAAGCFVTEQLAALTRAAPPQRGGDTRTTRPYVAVEAAAAGVAACVARGIPRSRLLQHDLRLPLALHRRFDVAVCTEVAEHVETPFAAQLVLSLVAHSDVVWFSAARPRSEKPGYPHNHVHHLNEQPDAFWIALFDFYGYDYVRPVHDPAAAQRWASASARPGLTDAKTNIAGTPTPTPDPLSARDEDELRQRGRMVFFNRETVAVDAGRLRTRSRGSKECAAGGARACSDEGNFAGGASAARWLDPWADV
jgi:hypothetical protein